VAYLPCSFGISTPDVSTESFDIPLIPAQKEAAKKEIHQKQSTNHCDEINIYDCIRILTYIYYTRDPRTWDAN